MGVNDPFLAYQFDRAVYLYGYRVDQLLEAKKKVRVSKPKESKGHYVAKPKYTLNQALQKAAGHDMGSGQAFAEFIAMRETGVTTMDD